MPFNLVIDVRKAFDAGIGTYIRNVVPRVLDRLGSTVRCTVVLPSGDNARFEWLTARDVRVLSVRAAPLGIAEQVELAWRLNKGDIFWATSLAHPLLHRGPVLATIYDVAQLALARDAEVPAHIAWAARLLLASQRRHAIALMAISEFTRREFEHYVGNAACGPIGVTPLGVDKVWFDAAATSWAVGPATPYFVGVGSVRPHKNFARLLQAFALAADRLPHDLVIAGLEPEHGQHLQWLEALPSAIRPRVRFVGFVQDPELRALVAGADALVFPSLYEGFGLPALEAMAAGCPVLSSSAGSLPEVCSDAAAAYFDPRSVEQISQALVGHAALPAGARRVIVERGVAHAKEFTWERTADITAEFIETALRGSGKPA